jgi:transitional endoplasmic reticulum ATPase
MSRFRRRPRLERSPSHPPREVGPFLTRCLCRVALARAPWHDPIQLEAEWPVVFGVFGLSLDTGSDRAIASLRAELAERLALAVVSTEPDVALAGLDRLSETVGFDPVERAVFSLLCVAARDCGIDALWTAVSNDGRGPPSTRFIAEALAMPEPPIEAALASTGRLRRSGLVRCAAEHLEGFVFPYGVHRALRGALDEGGFNLGRVVDSVAPSLPREALGVADFAHVGPEVELAARLLVQARARSAEGINVLLYGPPGTGKTALARALAHAAGPAVHGIIDRPEADPFEPDSRLQSYAAAQALLCTAPGALLVFDEVEDVFPHPEHLLFGLHRRAGPEKAWTLSLLETNRVPAVWIANRIEHIDPAILRRFSLVLDVREPTAEVRRRMARAEFIRLGLPESVAEACADRVERDDRLTPADILRAARVACLIDVGEGGDRLAAVDRILSANARTLRGAGAPTAPQRLEAFDPGLSRTDVDLDALTAGLAERGEGSVLLYGPPGTGKTAFAYHVARSTGQPIEHVRASDLLAKYVGETEARIAQLFARARSRRAIVFIDEAESFLHDRRGADRSWEVSRVDELLVQMEAAQCVFLCATNLVDRLDPASFRRFDVKVRFDHAQPDAVLQLIAAALRRLGASEDALDSSRLARRCGPLPGVSPGDIRATERRFAILRRAPEPEAFADALRADLRLQQPAGGGRLGFGV